MKTETSSTCSNLYSHPDVLLEDHLRRVKTIAMENYNQILHCYNPQNIDPAVFGKLLTIACLCHDLGKATPFFQNWLLQGEKSDFSKHALLSAIQAFFVVKHLLKTTSLEKNDQEVYSFLVYMAIRRHHGNFGNFKYDIQLNPAHLDFLIQQAESISDQQYSILIQLLSQEGLPFVFQKKDIFPWIKEFVSYSSSNTITAYKHVYKRKNYEYFFFENLLFSLLIDADKTEVTIGTAPKRWQYTLTEEVVTKYKKNQKFPSSKLNTLRESAYNDILEYSIEREDHLYSLNLPTGLGKTFDVMAFALKLRNARQITSHYPPRIIYALPFLSIIDQNAEIVSQILSTNGSTPPSNLLLKHHHLSDPTYKEDELSISSYKDNALTSVTNDFAKILIEGWNSEIIITTFVQVFETLFGFRNRSLKKLHRMVGSILILDEIQSIPIRYWDVLNRSLKYLTDHWNMTILFVTATQPEIFTPTEMKSLVDSNQYFSSVNRISLIPQLNKKLTVKDFADSLDMDNDKSYLFIVNTIKCAKELYEEITNLYPNEEIQYITSHIIPLQRLERIHNLQEHKSRIAITTQLIEAGVDIDFDIVYRDIAPLDSINQACGRCNRNAKQHGETHVIHLANEEGKSYSSFIYDHILLEQTKELLQSRQTIEESLFQKMLKSYYKRVRRRMSSDISNSIESAIQKLIYCSEDNCEPAVNNFKLISSYEKLSVFVEIDENASTVWNQYENILKIPNKFERRSFFDEIKADFSMYQIAISINSENLPPENHGLRFISIHQLDQYYDCITGFRPNNNEAMIW